MILSLLPFAFLFLLFEPVIRYFWDEKKLRRFPEATYLSGVTNIPFLMQRWRGFRSKEIHSVHEKHPVLRLGPNSLSFSSPAAIRAIYGHSTPCRKGGSYERALSAHPGLIEVVDQQEHASKRRILSNAFATRNLEQWEFKIADKVEQMVRQFDRICDEAESGKRAGVIDFRKWANLFSVEAIVDIALSEKLGCLERGDDNVTITSPEGEAKQVRFIRSLHSARRPTSMIVWSNWFRELRFLLESIPGPFRTQSQVGKGFTKILEYLVRRRVTHYAEGDSLDDLVHCLLEDKSGQPRHPSMAGIEGDVSTLLDAGSETTAIALTHVMYFLLNNPTALSRLREEIDQHMVEDENGVAKYESVKGLPYLRACLDESLRLLPPISTGLHRLTPKGGMNIDGHWIAGNTIVAVPIYTAHRNPDLFPEPETYEPGRWLKEGSKEAQASFIPFSAGARGCIGRNITYIEQTILVATLVKRYDFAFASSSWKLSHEEGFNLWPGSMPLEIKKREVN